MAEVQLLVAQQSVDVDRFAVFSLLDPAACEVIFGVGQTAGRGKHGEGAGEGFARQQTRRIPVDESLPSIVKEIKLAPRPGSTCARSAIGPGAAMVSAVRRSAPSCCICHPFSIADWGLAIGDFRTDSRNRQSPILNPSVYENFGQPLRGRLEILVPRLFPDSLYVERVPKCKLRPDSGLWIVDYRSCRQRPVCQNRQSIIHNLQS